MIQSVEELKSEIVAAQRAGDYLKEYDLAQAALELHQQEEYFQHCSVLALSRCNAKQRALDAFYAYKLHLSQNEYVRALEARILKDLAFQNLSDDGVLTDADRNNLHAAAATYQRAFARSGGHYAAVNAATLYQLAGAVDSAREFAKLAIQLAHQDTGPQYFALASQAEAYLLMGLEGEATRAIEQAAQHNTKNLLTRARTYFQLKLICTHLNIDAKIIAPLLPETVVHYCGHAFNKQRPITLQDEQHLSQRIEQALAQQHCAVAYGSLMAGSDILFAEAILRQGGELNIWLPFGMENFCAVAVRPAGEEWVARFRACIKAANTVSCATESDFLGDNSLFDFCSDVAMGMTLMRGNSLNAKVMQLAVWDQKMTSQGRGTYSNIEKWKKLGHTTEIIPSPAVIPTRTVPRVMDSYPLARREPHAILFADVRGFSKLNDRDILWYFTELHPRLAQAIEPYGADVQHIDTWGDAIFLVTEKASTAAQIALALNEVMAEIEQSGLTLAEPLLMRIGLHYGPVYKVYDHLTQCFTFASNDVTKTARIEPITPPGEVFGTEPFVAMLEIEGEGWSTFEYAGTIPSAKNFGAFRMFHVRPKHRNSALLCSLD